MGRGPYPTFDQETRTRMPGPAGVDPSGFEATTAPEPVIDSDEAAKFLNINLKTLQKMAHNGELPAYRLGKLWRFRISDLDGWLLSKVTSNCHSCRENERR